MEGEGGGHKYTVRRLVSYGWTRTHRVAASYGWTRTHRVAASYGWTRTHRVAASADPPPLSDPLLLWKLAEDVATLDLRRSWPGLHKADCCCCCCCCWLGGASWPVLVSCGSNRIRDGRRVGCSAEM